MSIYPVDARQRFSAAVLVIGDGLAAFSAALEAAARGQQTMIAAAGPALAAELTVALFGEVRDISDPHLEKLRERVAAVGGEHDGWLDPAIAQLVADQMMAEAGVKVLLYAIPIRVVEQEGRAAGVLMAGKDGLYTIAAGAVIDATENGALFRNSGAEFADPETIRASRTLYFEKAGGDVRNMSAYVADFALIAQVTWPDEVCITLTGEAAYDGAPVPAKLHRASRLAEQRVAKDCLAQMPRLSEALVTHSGHQMLPLSGPHLMWKQSAHSNLANLFGAGAWVSGTGWGKLAELSASGVTAAASACDTVPPIPPELSVREDLDLAAETVSVATFGGGTGGPLAAWAAARNGAQSVIFEAGWSLGGIATCGGIHYYYHGVPGGLQQIVHDTADAIADDLGGRERVQGFHPEARKIALEQLLLEAGVDVRYGWTAAGVVREGDRIKAVLLASPGQLQLVEPAIAIDATGDGDVLAQADAPMAYGRAIDGLSHQYSQSGGCMRGEQLGHHNFDAGYVDPRDITDLTRARRHALQLYWKPESFGGADRLFNVAYLLGLRQSRHIIGDYVLSLNDQVTNRHFPDVVAYGSCHQDNHAFDYENENDDALLWCWGLGFWKRLMRHELPYRCLTPQGLSNALVACRAVSVSREAHMLFRMIRDMYRIGEAAGTAAALALQKGGDVRGFDVSQLQDKLRATGALLEDWPAEETVPTAEALVAELVDELPRVAVWHLYQQGEAAVPALLTGLASENESTRWWSAVALAMIGRAEAADVLLQALQSHDGRLPRPDPNEPEVYLKRMAPRWLMAAMLLGKLQEKRTLEPIAAILDNPAQEPNWLIGAVRALGRLGDPAAIEPLQTFIFRGDLPITGEYIDALGKPAKPSPDVAWQLQLATAETLTKLGAPAPELVKPYLNDERAYVREYAAKLLR
ncbi:MAG: FAD-dependent oxidoreductase [Armatimonadota bacterium]